MDTNPNPDHANSGSEQPSTPESSPASPSEAPQSPPAAPSPYVAPPAPQAIQPPLPPQQPLGTPPAMEGQPGVVQQPASPYAQPAVPQPVQPGMQAPAVAENPEKNYFLALAFSFLLGTLGVDRFYLGYIGTGILKLVTFGGFGIWHFIDLMLISFGKLKEKGNPAPLEGYTKHHSSIKPVAILLLVIDVLVIVGFILLMIFGIVLGAISASQDPSSQPLTPVYSQPSTFSN